MGRTRVEPHLTVVLIAAAAAMFAVKTMRLELPVVDDAAITLSYARTFFAGGGARLTFASAPVEGFSDPLWLLLSGLAFPLGLEPIRFAQELSIACGALAVVLSSQLGRALSGRSLQLEDAIAPWILCFMPTFAFWAEAGMESCLYALLLVASVLFAVAEARTRRGCWTGIALAALGLTRPEAPLTIAAVALVWLATCAIERRRPGRQELRIALAIALVLGGYLALRGWYFARLVPNTFYAKRWWDYDAHSYIWSFVETYPSTLVMAALGAAIVLGFGSFAARRAIVLLVLVLAGAVVFAIRSRGDWMPEWRFFAPFCPLLAMAIGAAAIVLRARIVAMQAPRGRVIAATLGFAFVVMAMGVIAGDNEPRFAVVMGKPGLSADAIRAWGADLAELRGALGLSRARWAIPDVGGTSLVSPDDEMIDAAGLADYAIAEHVDSLPAVADYLTSEGLPDLIDVHGQSRLGDPAMQGFSDQYRPWRGNGWVLRGLTRGTDPRCPGGLAHVETMPLPQFLGELRAVMAQKDATTAITLWRCGEQHRGVARMPDWAKRARLRADAERFADDAATPLERLRFLSLATILSDENAHLRRETEALRTKLFPPP